MSCDWGSGLLFICDQSTAAKWGAEVLTLAVPGEAINTHRLPVLPFTSLLLTGAVTMRASPLCLICWCILENFKWNYLTNNLELCGTVGKMFLTQLYFLICLSLSRYVFLWIAPITQWCNLLTKLAWLSLSCPTTITFASKNSTWQQPKMQDPETNVWRLSGYIHLYSLCPCWSCSVFYQFALTEISSLAAVCFSSQSCVQNRRITHNSFNSVSFFLFKSATSFL